MLKYTINVAISHVAPGGKMYLIVSVAGIILAYFTARFLSSSGYGSFWYWFLISWFVLTMFMAGMWLYIWSKRETAMDQKEEQQLKLVE